MAGGEPPTRRMWLIALFRVEFDAESGRQGTKLSIILVNKSESGGFVW